MSPSRRAIPSVLIDSLKDHFRDSNGIAPGGAIHSRRLARTNSGNKLPLLFLDRINWLSITRGSHEQFIEDVLFPIRAFVRSQVIGAELAP